MKREIKSLENTRNYRKTKKGLVTNLFHKMKTRNTVSFDLQYLHNFSNCRKFERLFREWEKSNYDIDKKPSLDRISYKIGYTPTNIQWLTWGENRYKQRMELKSIRAKKVVKILNGNVIEIYNSVSEAVRKCNMSQGNLSSCLNGKRKTSGGFEWEYINHKNLTKSKHIKTCDVCKSNFSTYNKNQKACSKKCASTGNKNAKK